MQILKALTLASVMMLATVVGARPVDATPTDGGSAWSYGGLRIADVAHGGDNDVYVQFRNPDGTIRNKWPNASGADICGGATNLRLSRARTNFKEVVEALNIAGLAGRNVHVWYEPTSGTCYIKAISVNLS
ncbi:hypothetical protein WME94_14045 [Sorangium sp. So ce429]